jgi:hypothetical protein
MPDAADLKLTDDIKALVSSALDTGNPMLLGAVDPAGKPLLSFRGSTVPFSETQLSFWARNASGGTLAAIRQNPQVALMYRSATVPLLQFTGTARITEDAEERERAFSLSSPKEQERDPDRTGVAVIVDLDTISGVLGFDESGPIFCNMARTAKA